MDDEELKSHLSGLALDRNILDEKIAHTLTSQLNAQPLPRDALPQIEAAIARRDPLLQVVFTRYEGNAEAAMAVLTTRPLLDMLSRGTRNRSRSLHFEIEANRKTDVEGTGKEEMTEAPRPLNGIKSSAEYLDS
ncbi:hypothetical protein HK104_009656 [Borealophlyctis nickersoniae]|nr:hypothetical protein HK104_009656 [Borealophlyctis nickersoniae]